MPGLAPSGAGAGPAESGTGLSEPYELRKGGPRASVGQVQVGRAAPAGLGVGVRSQRPFHAWRPRQVLDPMNRDTVTTNLKCVLKSSVQMYCQMQHLAEYCSWYTGTCGQNRTKIEFGQSGWLARWWLSENLKRHWKSLSGPFAVPGLRKLEPIRARLPPLVLAGAPGIPHRAHTGPNRPGHVFAGAPRCGRRGEGEGRIRSTRPDRQGREGHFFPPYTQSRDLLPPAQARSTGHTNQCTQRAK
jgi:hypothetical protein